MRRLICAFVVRIGQKQVFSWQGSNVTKVCCHFYAGFVYYSKKSDDVFIFSATQILLTKTVSSTEILNDYLRQNFSVLLEDYFVMHAVWHEVHKSEVWSQITEYTFSQTRSKIRQIRMKECLYEFFWGRVHHDFGVIFVKRKPTTFFFVNIKKSRASWLSFYKNLYRNNYQNYVKRLAISWIE